MPQEYMKLNPLCHLGRKECAASVELESKRKNIGPLSKCSRALKECSLSQCREQRGAVDSSVVCEWV